MGLSKSQSCLTLSNTTNVLSSNSSFEKRKQPKKKQKQKPGLKLSDGSSLNLPRGLSAPDLDAHLRSNPKLREGAFELSKHRFLDRTKYVDSSTCLNVLQGEVAHASERQMDVLVSAEATTCHVVAVRSSRNQEQQKTTSTTLPLTSLAHIDECNPECLEKIVQEHLEHHTATTATLQPLNGDDNEEDDFGFFDAEEEEPFPMDDDDHHTRGGFLQQPTTAAATTRRGQYQQEEKLNPQQQEKIQMDLHIAGGFLDPSSQKLTKELVEEWSKLAEKYSDQLEIHLKTAAVSSLNNQQQNNAAAATKIYSNNKQKKDNNSSSNNNNNNAPKTRGLGIDTKTGHVFSVPTSLPRYLEGPAIEVRNARVWASQQQQQELNKPSSLAVIHDRNCPTGTLIIEPFDYKPNPQLNALLTIPDSVLKQVASTSPDQESDRFCSDLRRTVSFINSGSKVFGENHENLRPLVYTRSTGNLHEWIPTTTTTKS